MASTSCSAATPRVSPAATSVAEGLDPDSDEGQARYAELLEKHEAECKAEGDKVRELGGLYVLGTERHESRRIDNQLRGRSGRQGDPGESRFYLSLDDDLMRFFATGRHRVGHGRGNWEDDVPIEAKMVTRAIEKAQNTVEARNGEIRKNVLKYDEVMNEQRKVIYKRRDEVLEGVDLRDETMQALAEAVDGSARRRTARPTTPRSGTSRRSSPTPANLLADRARSSSDARGRAHHRRALRRADGRRDRATTTAREEELGADDDARHRASGDAPDHRRPLARPPQGDGLPPGGHQPPCARPEGPAHRVAA